MSETTIQGGVKNSLTDQLENMLRMQTNVTKLYQSFAEILTSKTEKVTVELENVDGSTTEINTPTNSKLFQDFAVLQETLNSLTDLVENGTGTIVSDGIREFISTSYKRTDKQMENVSIGENVNIETTSIFERLMSPTSYINVDLPEHLKYHTKIAVAKIFVSDFSSVTNLDSYSTTLQKIGEHKIIKDIIDTTPIVDRYSGVFDITNINVLDTGNIECTLNKITYSDYLNQTQDSRELIITDQLVSSDGRSVFEVVNIVGNVVSLARIKGLQPITTGVNALCYHNKVNTQKTAKIVVNGGDKFILFLAPINKTTDIQGNWSNAILVDSTKLNVIENDIEYSFDNYFSTRIRNVGKYLEQLTQEQTLPTSIGVKPNAVVLSTDNFKVVQINKHITSGNTAKKLQDLRSNKENVYSSITVTNAKLSTVNDRLSKGNYKSVSDKETDLSERQLLTERLSIFNKQYESVVREINTQSANSNIGKTSPKFRVRGFFPYDLPVSEIDGSTQTIVQTKLQYRYVSVDTGNAEPAIFDINGQTAIKTAWIDYNSEPLKRVKDVNTNLWVWESSSISDVDINNINQVDIPINYGEDVEFRVLLVSEAGWPTNPIVSDWSNIIKMSFPETLAGGITLAELVDANAEDLKQIEISNQIAATGITQHIKSSRTEAERYIAHDLNDIASGDVSSNGTTITAYEKIRTLENALHSLQETIQKQTLTPDIEIISPDGKINKVNRFGTVGVFAGYYTDEVDINNAANFGAIVSKTILLRITNNNQTTLDISSLSNGILSDNVIASQYENVPIMLNGESAAYRQRNGQILYVRNTDISGGQLLYDLVGDLPTTVPQNLRNDNANEAAKNIVEYSNGTFNKTALFGGITTDNFVAIETNSETYTELISSNFVDSEQELITDFARASKYDFLNKNLIQADINNITGCGFHKSDKYLIGSKTTGAQLFVQPYDFSSIQVSSNDFGSVRELKSGESNAIIIPIKFEFRMLDALGKLSGNPNLSVTSSNVEYRKKIGIDLILGQTPFKFDLQVSAKFRPTAISSNVNITELSGTRQANISGSI